MNQPETRSLKEWFRSRTAGPDWVYLFVKKMKGETMEIGLVEVESTISTEVDELKFIRLFVIESSAFDLEFPGQKVTQVELSGEIYYQDSSSGFLEDDELKISTYEDMGEHCMPVEFYIKRIKRDSKIETLKKTTYYDDLNPRILKIANTFFVGSGRV